MERRHQREHKHAASRQQIENTTIHAKRPEIRDKRSRSSNQHCRVPCPGGNKKLLCRHRKRLPGAKGAVSILAWGTAPGVRSRIALALKARFNSQHFIIRDRPNVRRAFSADGWMLSQSWGAAPGCEIDVALLALNPHRPKITNCCVVIGSKARGKRSRTRAPTPHRRSASSNRQRQAQGSDRF